MKAVRLEFADTMLEVGQRDSKLVVMVGDISHGILQNFAKACPGRFYNVGICEPTIVNMAAGLSKSGLIPVVHTIIPFIIERAYEQIKLDFGYQQLGVNLIGIGGAFDYAQLGCSHHCYTDLSLMGHFKHANIFYPASPIELNQLFKQVYNNGQINYFKVPDFPHEVVFAPEDIKAGQGICIKEGKDVTILVIGHQLKTVLDTAKLLDQQGVDAEILYYHTIKPFDENLLQKSVSKTGHVIVIEEASAHDGVFNYVLKATQNMDGIKYAQVAIDDFIHGYGTYQELCAKLGFSPQGIIDKILSSFPSLQTETV